MRRSKISYDESLVKVLVSDDNYSSACSEDIWQKLNSALFLQSVID